MKRKERLMRGWLGGTGAALAFILLAAVALGAGASARPPQTPAPQPRPVVTRIPIATPVNRATIAPVATMAPNGLQCRGINLKTITSGTKVPLSCLPHLPMKMRSNTVTPADTKGKGRVRPMAASGATIDLTPGAGCGSSGALFSVGCSMGWQATNNGNWSTSDSYADYYVPPNATTATLVGTNGYAYNAATAHSTTMSVQGVYAFFVYDNTAQVIISVVYASAGAPFSIGVYQDPYHTQQSYQFDVNNSGAAYIYLPDVSTTDAYVVYVMSTSVNGYCVYLTPAATPAPSIPTPRPTGAPNSLICNPNTSPGITAPSGTLSLQWPLNSNYQAGTYSIVVYDQTAGAALGQVQVSLTGVEGYTFQLYPTPGPNQTPAAYSTPPTTVFAWDSVNEQSDGGLVASAANQIGTAPTNGVYTLTATDPDGQVVEIPTTNTVPNTCTSLSNSASNCTVTGTFNFSAASPALTTPGNYPNNTWTMQLYAAANKELEASQYFQIKGYSLQTNFIIGGVQGQSLSFGLNNGVENQAATMVFTNNANIKYPNAADPIKGILYTTGAGSSLTRSFAPPSNTTGNGVTIGLTGCTGAYNTVGCSKTVTDSTGGSWTLTDYCSVANPNNNNAVGSQCVLQLLPQNGVDLTPGASITVSGLTFYARGGSPSWPCYYTPCSTPSSILPLDGLSWSNTTASSPAWTAVYYGSTGASIIGTANAHYVGSAVFPGNTSRYAVAEATSPPNLPWTNTHFYPSQFAQGEYQDSTPFQAQSGRDDILVVDLTACNGGGGDPPGCSAGSGLSLDEIEITFPSGINASQITVDPSEPTLPDGNGYYVMATNGGNACINTPPTNGICLNPGGSAYNTGGNNGNTGVQPTGNATTSQGEIWLDVPAGEASFIAQEIQVQAYSTQDLFWQTLTADGHTVTPVVGGGAAGPTLDSLSLQGLSLNANLMGAQFDPATVSPSGGTTAYSLVFTNTLPGADPNPDPIDAVVIEQTTNKTWTLSAPTVSGTGSAGWTSLSGTGYNPSGNTMEYWFGLNGCSQFASPATAGPPQTPPTVTNPTTQQTQLTGGGAYCTAAQEQNAIASGGSMSFNFKLANTTTGTQTFYVYAHGANGGGWANLKTITVNSVNETASAQVFSVAQGGTDASCVTTQNVAANTVATVAKSPNCFIYEVKNTSGGGTQNIGTTDISLPAYDINGLATGTGDWTLVGSPITQYVVLGTISGGTFKTTGIPAGCSINAANVTQPVPGSAAGEIEVHGCTGFTPGTNIAVEFVANTPQVESDSYLLPATIDGASAGIAWTGSDEVAVAFSLGLSISVDPANPGPGNSHPAPNCVPAQCAFSGTVLDFGTIPANTTVVGTDVVRATVVYEGGSLAGTCPAGAGVGANTWQLEVNLAAANPSNELFTSVDEGASTSGLTYATGVNTYFNPTTSTTVLSCGQESSSTDYDSIMNFEAVPGTDTSSHIVTVIYTLIAN